MSDLISRQAVLKHIEKIRQEAQMMDDTRRASIIMNGMYLCEKAVMNQPSAQPEIIRCKDCKHYDGEKCLRYEPTKWKFYVVPDDFCSYGERADE